MPFDSLDYGAPLTTRRKRLLKLRSALADKTTKIDLNEFEHPRTGCCVGGLAFRIFHEDGLDGTGSAHWQAQAAQFLDISLAYGTFSPKQTARSTTHREEALARLDRLLDDDAKGTLRPYKPGSSPADILTEYVHIHYR